MYYIVSGLSGIEILQDFGLLISDVFTKIFKFISLPVIVLSIIAALSQYSASSSMSKVWKRTVFYPLVLYGFITATFVAKAHFKDNKSASPADV